MGMKLRVHFPIRAYNGGLFISRGRGKHPERTIDSYQVLLVSKGQLNIWEEDKSYYLKEGNTLLLYPGHKHGGIDQYQADSSFFWLHFAVNEDFIGYEDHILEIPKIKTFADPERLIELFRRFLDDQESGRLTPFRGNLLVLEILNEIAESDKPEEGSRSNDAVLADRINRYIRTHFHEKITTSLIADRLKCNPDYLGRVFRSAYHKTITDFINDRRIHYARTLLINSDFNINEIASECGFNYANYFQRTFKRHEGMTPKSFRRLFAKMHVNAE